MKKNILLPLIGSFVLLQACSEDPTQSDQYKQLQEDRGSLMNENSLKDSTINEMFGAFNRVTENLRAIREKQGLLSGKRGGIESGTTMEDNIVADLRAIDSLLSANKRIVAELRRTAGAEKGKLNEMQKAVLALEESLSEKDVEIVALKEQLTSTNASLASMIDMYKDQEQLASNQQAELRTAYYTVGSQKELREHGVLSRSGGVAGIGRVSKLNTDGAGSDHFKKIDIGQVTTIPIGARKATLVTSHPEGSFRFAGTDNVEKLEILDAAKFWSVSKYLVVQTD